MKHKLMITSIALFMVIAFGACGKETEVFETIESLNKVTQPVQREEKKEDSEEPIIEPTNTIEPNNTPYYENEDSDTIHPPILMTTPPFSYYISDNAIYNKSNSITLNMKSNVPNNIIDDAEWFIDNNLSINTFQVPNPFQYIDGNLPDEIDKEWNDLIITAAFYDDSYVYCTYGTNFSEGYILNIYDLETFIIEYSFDFTNYKYSTDYIQEDYDYIQQKIVWAEIKNNILYISHSHNTYAKSSNNMNAYITAIDLADMSILWRTNALVCNSYNFLIIDDVIVCGYGFTDEPDFLNLVDINTGDVLDKIPLKSAASYIINKDNLLYVRTYNTDYEFDIIK